MAGILDFQMPDYSKVGQGVQRAELPGIPEQGFLGQAVADDIQARKNFMVQQPPAPLMPEQSLPLQDSVVAPVQQEVAPSVSAQPVVVAATPQVVQAEPKETPAEKKQIKEAYTEGKRQVAAAAGVEDEMLARQQRLAQINADKQKAWEEGQRKAQEADAEAAKIEPKDYWADKSTGSKIAAAIAMGLGAYGAAMTGTQNTPMQIINDAITRDMGLQKEKFQRAKDRGATIRSQYADTVARLGDQEAAELTLMNSAYRNIDMKLRAQEAATQNQVQLMNIQKMRQEIAASMEAAQMKRAERLALQQASKGNTSKINPQLLSEDNRKRYIDDPNFGGLARSESAANKVSEALIEYRNARDLLGTLQEINKVGGKSISPELRARAQTSAAALKGKLKGPIVGSGAVSESEWKILDSIVADPTKFFSLDAATRERLNSISNLIDANMKNTASAYGISGTVPLSEANQVMVKVDGKTGYIPSQNLESFKKAMTVQKRKFEVLSGQ